MSNMLLVDCCESNGFVLNLNESTEKGTTRFRGKFQEAEATNKNNRVYPFRVLDENVKKLSPIIEARGLVGELDHPTDSVIHFEKASHIVTKIWWEGNNLMGEGEILNTPAGRILKALLNDGVRVGISSRGVGNGKDENGKFIIGESYKLITFDAVADPSTHAAFQEKVVGKKESYVPTNDFKSNEITEKKTISKDALLACLGGIIESKTHNITKKL